MTDFRKVSDTPYTALVNKVEQHGLARSITAGAQNGLENHQQACLWSVRFS